MKNGRLGWFQLYMGILLLVAGTIFNGAIVAKVIAMNGRYGFGKVTAKVKNQLDPEGRHGLTINETLKLELNLETGAITYGAKTACTTVTFDNRNHQAQIQGVNSRYPEFHQLKQLQGAFWDQSGDAKAQMVAVIDQDLAWSIFKNNGAVGRVLRIMNQPMRIIGVIASDDSLLASLTDSGTPKVYVPAAALLNLDSQARVTELEWQTANLQGGVTNTLDLNQTVLKGALQQAGQNPADYNISDWNIKRVLLEQKPRLITLVVGFLIMLMVFRYLAPEVRKLYNTLKEEWRNEYLGKVLKLKAGVIRGTALKAVLGLGVIGLVWGGSLFKPYIPPRYIPDELINTAYYFNLFQSNIRAGIGDQGYIPAYGEQILRQAEALTRWLLFLGLVGGLPFLYGGFRKLKVASVGADRIMLLGGLGMIGAVLVTAVGAWMVGVPLVMDLRSVLIIWAFVFGKTVMSQGVINI